MAKPKKITSVGTATAESTRDALQRKFPQFQFSVAGTDIVADGPWDRPASERPALGTMQVYADGYIQALIDQGDREATQQK